MLVGVVAVSTSGPLMAATAAPALAIAFWRNGFASAVLLPWALLRQRGELRGLTAEGRRLCVLAGLLLGLHFATWVPSLTYTSVASATAMVSTQPLWVALLAQRTGARLGRLAWCGIGLAVCGAAVVSGVDFDVSRRALLGDLLGVAGGVFAAGYTVAGAAVRRRVTTTTYTAFCYPTAAVALLVLCVVARQRLVGYDAGAWWRLVAVTVFAQFLGHSVFNRVLRTVSPTMVSLAILLEVPGAGLIAALFLHQTPHASAVPGLALLLGGLGLVTATRDRRTAASVPVE
jgi:drug/metabolite transporter (DMT)-like permease